MAPFPKILLVTPKRVYRQALSESLSRRIPLTTIRASGPEEAASALNEGSIIVTILDMETRGAKAFLAAMADRFPEVRFIALVGQGKKEAVPNSPEADAEVTNLSRSVSLSRLVDAVAEVCPAQVVPKEKIPNLTPREVQVLRLIARGCPNKEIAKRLCVSLSTVKTHAHNIYAKAHVSGRGRAVAEIDL